MEKIREKFGFDRWMVVGGSWGATLALAYAQAHPERVSGIALRATFLGTRAEVETAFTSRLSQFYPALYEDFLSVLPLEERERPVEAYYRRILDTDPAVHGPASRAWHDTERALSEHKPARTRLDLASLNVWRTLPATPFMEAHYFVHDSFMTENQLLRNADRLAGIPGIIVQGRYDLLCPPATSHALAAAWGNAKIRIVDAAGHSLTEPGVQAAVTSAINELT
jgi:proline iminopeptidase